MNPNLAYLTTHMRTHSGESIRFIAKPVASIAVFLVFGSLATLTCSQTRAPIDLTVKAEIVTVDAQITEAEAENAKYAGGLSRRATEGWPRLIGPE
jgi:hypothetical protein